MRNGWRSSATSQSGWLRSALNEATFSREPWTPERVEKAYAAWQGICEKEGLELFTGQPVDQSLDAAGGS